MEYASFTLNCSCGKVINGHAEDPPLDLHDVLIGTCNHCGKKLIYKGASDIKEHYELAPDSQLFTNRSD